MLPTISLAVFAIVSPILALPAPATTATQTAAATSTCYPIQNNVVADGDFENSSSSWQFQSKASSARVVSGSAHTGSKNAALQNMVMQNAGNPRIESPDSSMSQKLGAPSGTNTYQFSYWYAIPWNGGQPSCTLKVSVGATTIDTYVAPAQWSPLPIPYTQRTATFKGVAAGQSLNFTWSCPMPSDPNAYLNAEIDIDTVTVSVLDTNKVVNGNFEKDLTSWQASTGVVSAGQGYAPYEGTRSADYSLSKGSMPLSLNQTLQGVTVGEPYVLSYSYAPLYVVGQGSSDEDNTCWLNTNLDGQIQGSIKFTPSNQLPYVEFTRNNIVPRTSSPLLSLVMTCGKGIVTGRINVDVVSFKKMSGAC